MKKQFSRFLLSFVAVLMFFGLSVTGDFAGTQTGNPYAITAEAASKTTKLNKSKLTLTTGADYTVKLLNKSGKTITATKVKWSSSSKKVATVSKKGVIKAVKAGTATIKATYKKKTYTCKVTVKNATLSAKSKTLSEGKSFTLTLKNAGGKKVSAKDIKWSTKSKSVATVSSKGVVKAVGGGSTTITATYLGKKYTCKVTVKKPAPTSTMLYEDSNVKVYYSDVKKSTYDSDRVELYLNVYNKTNKEIKVQCDSISFNGYCFNYIIASDDVQPKSTGSVEITIRKFDFSLVDLNNIEYVGGQLRIISDAFRTYDALFVNKSLYGKADLKTPPAVSGKKVIFSNANITMYYGYSERSKYDEDELEVYILVQNNSEYSTLVQNDDVIVCGTRYTYTIMSDNILPFTTGYVNVTVNDCYASPSSVKTIGGTFRIIDEAGVGRTYDATMGNFTDYDPWASAYGKDEYIEDDEDYDDDYDDDYDEDEDYDDDDSSSDESLWSYSDVTKIGSYYQTTKGYSDKLYTQYQNSARVNNLTMKVSYLNLAKGYANLAKNEMQMLINHCATKAEIGFTYTDGTHSNLLELCQEIYNEFEAITLLEVSESNARDCESEIGRRYVTVTGKYVSLTKIYSQLLGYYV